MILCGLACLLGLLALQFWVLPTKFSGWLALVTVGLPTWFILEWLGERAIGAESFKKMSSAGRIAVGVPILIALFAVAALLAGVVRHLAGSS